MTNDRLPLTRAVFLDMFTVMGITEQRAKRCWDNFTNIYGRRPTRRDAEGLIRYADLGQAK